MELGWKMLGWGGATRLVEALRAGTPRTRTLSFLGKWRSKGVEDSTARRIGSLRSESGQDLAEYGLLISLIALVVVAAVTLFGSGVLALFQRITDNLPFGG